MAIQAIKNVEQSTCNEQLNFAQKTRTAKVETANLSELLSNNKHASPKHTEEKSSLTSTFILAMIGITFFCFMRAQFSCSYRKLGLERLKKVHKNMSNFKDIFFTKSSSTKELNQMAEKLNIKIKYDKQPDKEDIFFYNEFLSILADAHNKSKGRIKIPKVISIKNLKGNTEGITFINDEINICRKSFRSKENFQKTVCHELGHINFNERRKFQDTIPVFLGKILGIKKKDFLDDEDMRRTIRILISEYATTNRNEFVAESFAKLMCGQDIPARLKMLYAQTKGIPRVPVVRNIDLCKDV